MECNDYLAEWRKQDTEATKNQKTISDNTALWNEQLRWYEVVNAYNQKIVKAKDDPAAIKSALESLKQEAGKISGLAGTAHDDMKPYLKSVMEAFNKANSAIDELFHVKRASDELAKTDDKYKDSGIKKTLDTIYDNHKAVNDTAKANLALALNPLRHSLALKNALGDSGLRKRAGDMITTAEGSSKAATDSAHYKEITNGAWKAAKDQKQAQDNVRADLALNLAMMTAYETAMKVKGCDPPTR
jgi:hypothetical protein